MRKGSFYADILAKAGKHDLFLFSLYGISGGNAVFVPPTDRQL